jgi:hypothetical protein
VSESAAPDFGEILNDGLNDVDVDAEDVSTPEPDAEAEAVAAELDTPDEPEPEDAATDGIPRDEHGRFAPRNAQEEAAVAAAEPTPEPKPFEYRAMNATRVWEGATVQADGSVTIAPEKVGAFRAALNAQALAEGEHIPLIERYKQEVQHYRQAAEQRSLATQKSEALVASLQDALLDNDEASFLEKMFNLRESLPSMMKDAEIEHYRQLAMQGRPPETAQPAEQAPQHSTHAMPAPEAALESTLDRVESLRIEDAAFKHLSPTDWKQLQETLHDTPFAFIRPATEEDAPYGVQPGQPVLDEARLRRYVEKFAAQVQKGARIAKSATEAAKFNAKTTSTAPAARAPRAMATATAPSVPLNAKQQSDAMLRDWMNKPGLDFDDD